MLGHKIIRTNILRNHGGVIEVNHPDGKVESGEGEVRIIFTGPTSYIYTLCRLPSPY